MLTSCWGLTSSDRGGSGCPTAHKKSSCSAAPNRVRKKSRFRKNGAETAENRNSDHVKSMGYRGTIDDKPAEIPLGRLFPQPVNPRRFRSLQVPEMLDQTTSCEGVCEIH